MRQERKIGEVFECDGAKIIVKKIAILYADVINASLIVNQNAMIIIAFVM